MRSFGSHRGNPALRIMIEQAARRRLWASLGPERPGAGSAGSGGACWTREFFTALAAFVREHFAAIDELPEGSLGYYGVPGMQLWSLCTDRTLVLALDHEDSPAQIHTRAARWNACLTTRTTPGLASPHWGHPVYGARIDPLSDVLDVVWAFAGEWCALATAAAPAPRAWGRPDHWQSLIGAGA